MIPNPGTTPAALLELARAQLDRASVERLTFLIQDDVHLFVAEVQSQIRTGSLVVPRPLARYLSVRLGSPAVPDPAGEL